MPVTQLCKIRVRFVSPCLLAMLHQKSQAQTLIFFQSLEAIGAVMMFRMSNESKAMLKSSLMLLLGSSLRCTLFTCYSLHTRFNSLQESEGI